MTLPTPLAVTPLFEGVDVAPAQRALEQCDGVATVWGQPGDPRPLCWLLRHLAALGDRGHGLAADAVLDVPRLDRPESMQLAGFPGSFDEFLGGAAAGDGATTPFWREVFDVLWPRLCADVAPAAASFYAELAPPWLAIVLRMAGLAPREIIVVEDPRRVLARWWRDRFRFGHAPVQVADPSLPWSLIEQLERGDLADHLRRVAATGCSENRWHARVEEFSSDAAGAAKRLRGWLDAGDVTAQAQPAGSLPGGADALAAAGLPRGVCDRIEAQLQPVAAEFGYVD